MCGPYHRRHRLLSRHMKVRDSRKCMLSLNWQQGLWLPWSWTHPRHKQTRCWGCRNNEPSRSRSARCGSLRPSSLWGISGLALWCGFYRCPSLPQLFDMLLQDRQRATNEKSLRFTYEGWESAGTQALLLTTAWDHSVKSHFWLATNVKCTDTFWSVDLVTADWHQVDVVFVYINRQLAYRLSGISVKEDFFLSAHLSYFFDRLHDADLVVDVDNAHCKCVRSDCLLKLLQGNKSIFLHRKVSNLEALFF